MPAKPRRFTLESLIKPRQRKILTLGALLAIGSLTLSGAALATPAQAEADITAEESAADEATAVQLIFAPEESSVSGTNDLLRLRTLIRNPGDTELSESTLVITFDQQPLTTFSATAPSSPESESDSAAQSPYTIAEITVTPTRAEAEQILVTNIAVSDLPFDLGAAEPGVYQLHAELRTAADTDDADTEEADADGADAGNTDAAVGEADSVTSPTASATTSVVWRGSQIATRVPLTTIVPLVLPQSVDTMPARGDLVGYTAHLDSLLTTAEARNATLAIDPRIIAAIRAYGSDAPATAQNFLSHLEGTHLSSFLLQFADADPSAQAALGVDTLITPSGLDYLTESGAFANAGSATGSGAAPTLPTLDELMQWEQGFAGAWPAEGSVEAATLELLRASDISTVVLDSENASVQGGSRFSLTEHGNIDALVADADLASAARFAVTSESEVEQDAARAEIASRLAISAQQQSTGVILALDRSATAESEDPSALIDWMNALDWVTATPLSEQPQGSGTLIPGPNMTSEQRLELLRAADRRSAQIVTLSPLLNAPEYLAQLQSVRMLWAFGTGFAGDDAAFTAVMQHQRETDDLYLQGVQVVTTVNTQLVGTSTQLPVQLHNSLPFDATLLMHVSPTSAAISVAERVIGPTLVVAGGNSTVLVPVRSRISSGESALLVQIADAADSQRFSSAILPLTLRTSLETILLSSLGACAALLLGLGIWRSVKRRRALRNNPAVG